MTKNTAHTVLKTQALEIGYKSKSKTSSIAQNINLSFNKGELIGLVGANGIGKSTFIRTLTKVQPSLNGNIILNDINLSEYNNLELAKSLSVVLTESVPSKNLSVFELVALGRHPYTNWVGNLNKKDLETVNQALEQTNILHLSDKKCYELSDGQLQKVMLSRALCQDTNLIILDEPTSHLDMYHKAYILKLLKTLTQETEKTILFSSHEIDLAIQLCDKIIVMTGETVEYDTPCNLISKGAFTNLFPSDLIKFDEKTGSFRVTK
ncbi:MAG: ABC transporter ATP-binding protein [Bacteroidetes bacterium MedPE-SWsnd-G2]|nr:MAG: ABC transporter ATP-binding protein [Bacteroidetes bacterium MedPE-SWsnd-G2]